MESSESNKSRPEPGRRELADLSALADGTLAPERRAEVQARIDASAELSELYSRERQVVSALREARASTRAPHSLRVAIDRQRPSRRVWLGRKAVYGAGLAGSLAAAVAALILVLPGGAPGAPSISQAAALASRGATTAAPTPDPSNPAVKLARAIGEVYFPNWSVSFGWKATGQRIDSIDGRRAVTVYYDWHGMGIAYTIVAAPALAEPNAAVTTLKGTVLRTLTLDGRLVVTWRRAHQTCVLSGVGVSARTLQNLAAWQAPGLDRTS